MKTSENENMKCDWCPCPVWGCPSRGKCREGTKSHLDKGHLNACGFYTILPAIEKLMALVDDPAIKSLIREMLIDPNANAYSLCNLMHEEMPIGDVIEYLSSPVQGLRCNANESLKKRTGLDVEYNPLSAPDEIQEGVENWKKALREAGLSTES